MPYRPPDDHGRPIPIIDCHQHVGNIHPEEWESDAWRHDDQAEREHYMRGSSIDRCVVMPMPLMTLTHANDRYAAANDMLATYTRERPDLVSGFCATVNPADAESARRELERCFAQLGAVGVSFHHRCMGLNADDPRMEPIVEIAQHFDRVVYVHILAESEMEAPWRLFSLARRYPDAKFLALDGFSSPHQSYWLLDAAGEYPNIWYDTGVATAVAHCFGHFIEKYGSERLVIGTDNYSGPRNFYTAFPVYEIEAIGLDRPDLERIAYRNLCSLLQIEPPTTTLESPAPLRRAGQDD